MKLSLDPDFEEDLPLVWGVSSTLEPHTLAFRLNSHAGFRFGRSEKDFLITRNKLAYSHALFTFDNPHQQCHWKLVQNRPYNAPETGQPALDLFGTAAQPAVFPLSRDKRKPDYLLCLWDDHPDSNPLVSFSWKSISGIQAAYLLNAEQLPVDELLIQK